MTYGMRIWGANGALQLDENSFTMRIAASILVTFSGGTKQQQDFSVPGCTPSNSVAIMVPIGSYNEYSRQHECELLSGTVAVRNYMIGQPANKNITSGTMRLMVIKFL